MVAITLFIIANLDAGYDTLDVKSGVGTETQTFTVTNNSVDETFTMDNRIYSASVRKWNGAEWFTMSNSYVSVAGRTVTIQANGFD